MAKITPSALLGSIKGSIAGLTFRGSGSSATVQSKPAHKRARTAAQDEQQLFLRQSLDTWNSLETRYQKSWDSYALQEVPFSTPRATRPATGRATFISWYSRLLELGLEPAELWPRDPVYTPGLSFAPAFQIGPPDLCAVFLVYEPDYFRLKLWVAQAPRFPSLSSRPIWTVLWDNRVDGAPDYIYFPDYPGYEWAADLSDRAAERIPDIFTGQAYQMRMVCSNGNTVGDTNQVMPFFQAFG